MQLQRKNDSVIGSNVPWLRYGVQVGWSQPDKTSGLLTLSGKPDQRNDAHTNTRSSIYKSQYPPLPGAFVWLVLQLCVRYYLGVLLLLQPAEEWLCFSNGVSLIYKYSLKASNIVRFVRQMIEACFERKEVGEAEEILPIHRPEVIFHLTCIHTVQVPLKETAKLRRQFRPSECNW